MDLPRQVLQLSVDLLIHTWRLLALICHRGVGDGKEGAGICDVITSFVVAFVYGILESSDDDSEWWTVFSKWSDKIRAYIVSHPFWKSACQEYPVESLSGRIEKKTTWLRERLHTPSLKRSTLIIKRLVNIEAKTKTPTQDERPRIFLLIPPRSHRMHVPMYLDDGGFRWNTAPSAQVESDYLVEEFHQRYRMCRWTGTVVQVREEGHVREMVWRVEVLYNEMFDNKI